MGRLNEPYIFWLDFLHKGGVSLKRLEIQCGRSTRELGFFYQYHNLNFASRVRDPRGPEGVIDTLSALLAFYVMEVCAMIIREQMEMNISDPACVATVIKDILRDESKIDREKEHFWTIGLNAQNKVKYIDLVSLGASNHANVNAMETFRLAVLKGCCNVVFAHNHPSGASKPSEEDFEITRTLSQAGKILGIKVLDHVIVGKEYYSFNNMKTLAAVASTEDKLIELRYEIMSLKRETKALRRALKKHEALR